MPASTRELTRPLGPTHPRTCTVVAEPFPSSALKSSLRSIFATTTKIFTRGGSGRDHSRTSTPPRRTSYSPRPDAGSGAKKPRSRCQGRPGMGPTLSAIHFQGGSVRQVSCYTLLGGFQLPWPPPCCQYRPTPFSFPVSVLRWAPQPGVRFIPQRQFCLPKMAHSAPVIRSQSP